MAVRARLPFVTVTGPDTERIEWQLDILDEGYTGTPLPLVGDGNSPVVIDYHKDDDIYKPIQGSSMRINLIVPNSIYVLPDFNAGREFQYEVRLRRVLADNSTVDYWCGYINPIESKESANTTPFPVSFTATDRLGALGDQSIIFANAQHDTSLVGYIGRALRQTGLDLPLYIDSGIRTADGDALLNTAANQFVFFDEDAFDLFSEGRSLGDRATLRESLRGVLRTFNCKIYQSEAKWWITNCSTHGSSTDVNTTYTQYVPDTGMTGRDTMNRFPGQPGYIPTANIEEYRPATASDPGGTTITVPTLRYDLDGSNTTDLSKAGDLKITLREALGSVEARPQDLVQDPLHPNTSFEDGAAGWENLGTEVPFVGSSPGVSLVDDSGTPTGQLAFTTRQGDFITGGRAMVTNRNRNRINDSGDAWFTSSVAVPGDINSPTTLSFNWKHRSTGSNMRDPRIPFRIRVELETPVDVQTLDTSTIASFLSGFSDQTVSRFYWNFQLEKWDTAPVTSLQRADDFNVGLNLSGAVVERTGTLNVNAARGLENDEWGEVSIQVPSYATFAPAFQSVDIPAANLFVDFYYPQGYRGTSGRRQAGDGTGRRIVIIDNVQLNDEFADNVDSPIFEYRQPSHNLTDDYAPSFTGSGPTTFRQYLTDRSATPVNVGPTSFWLKDETSTDGRSLEETITGLKLSDNKERLPYYEGNIINRTTTPLSQHHKINVNFPGYSENGVLILNGGSFDVKQNAYDFAGYIPQATALDSNDIYTPFNVDLIASRFRGARTKTRYILGVVVRGIDGTGVVADSVFVSNLMGGGIIDITADPGDVIQREIVFTPSTGFVTTLASTIVRPDSATEPRPLSVTFPTDESDNAIFRDQQATLSQSGATLGGSIVLPIEITVPNDDDFGQLHIDVGVGTFTAEDVPGITPASVVITNNIPNTLPASRTFDVSGIPGSVIPFSFAVSPSNPDTFELDASSVNPPSFSDTSLVAFPDEVLGGSVSIPFEYTVPTTTESVAVTITGSANPVSTATNPVFNFAVTTAGAPTNTTFFDASPVTHRNTPDSVVTGLQVIRPGNDYVIDAADFSANSTAGISNVRFTQAGQNVEMRYDVRIGSADTAGTITITAPTAATVEPFSLTFNPRNIGIEGATVSLTPSRQTYDVTDVNDSITPVVLTISSNDGMEFTASTQARVDVNEATVVTRDGTIVTLPESQFVVAAAAVPVVDGDLVFNISGTYPQGGDYVLDVNVDAQAANGPATAGSNFASGAGNTPQNPYVIPLAGGTFRIPVNANGSWAIETDETFLSLNTFNADETTGVAIFTATSSGANRTGIMRLLSEAGGNILDTFHIAQRPITVDDAQTATSASISVGSSGIIPGDGGSIPARVTVTGNVGWRLAFGAAGGSTAVLAPVESANFSDNAITPSISSGVGTTTFSISALPLSPGTNTGPSLALHVVRTDTLTSLGFVDVSQGSRISTDVVVVSALPANPIAGKVYIVT